MNRNDWNEQHHYRPEGSRPERRYRGDDAEWNGERAGFGREERPWRGREEPRVGSGRRRDGERGWSERDPGRDFGSEGYGVDSDEHERRGGREYRGRAYGGERGPGEYETRGHGAQSWNQRGFGGEGYEGRSSADYGARGERAAYGFGREGAGSASGRGWGSYDESGQYGGRERGDVTSGGSDLISERRRRIEGRFAGRGPKGYERSDDRIREDVCDRLMQDPEVDASDVTVRVESAEVTLEGNVDSKTAKRLAEDIAEEVAGVREVHNRLRVQRDLGGSNATTIPS